MKIEKILAREIFDSRGIPTIECEIILNDGTFVTSSVPSGLSKGKDEALELRDGGNRLQGLGVSKAIENIETIIAPALLKHEPNLVTMDVMMLELDGTDTKSKLGANAINVVSMAILKAQAAVEGLQLYELIAHICGMGSVTLPLPMFNVINGGVHADDNLQIQEFLIIPVNITSFRAAMEASLLVFYELKKLLLKKGKSVNVGDEGGFAANFKHEEEALDYLMVAIDKAKESHQGTFVIGLDVAASQFYDKKKKKYTWHGKALSTAQMIKKYDKLANEYPLVSLEDGLAEDDIKGWQELTEHFNKKMQIVGDDIFVTNPQKIWEGIEGGYATAAVIKPNQIGTMTETMQAIKLCKDYSYNVVVSHRSGETNDTFLADLAVGVSAGNIKAGGLCRGERMAKYNQLLRIEDDLVLGLLGV